MVIGSGIITFRLHGCRSLKEKRKNRKIGYQLFT